MPAPLSAPAPVLPPAPDAVTVDESSDQIRTFMARPAAWLLRSGSVVLAAMMVLLLVLAAIIRYPDTITGRVVITGTQPIAEVVARQSGHLESLRVREGQHVERGEILGIIENPARPEAIFELSRKVAMLSEQLRSSRPVITVRFSDTDELGRLQTTYAEFLQALRQFETKFADDFTEKALTLLRTELDAKKAQLETLGSQAESAARALELAQAKFERVKGLHEARSVSTAEFQEQELTFLGQMRDERVVRRSVLDAQIEVTRTERTIHDLEHERSESLIAGRESLRASVNRLRGEIEVWENEFVLRAPAAGKVAFFDFWSDQQYVTANKQVFVIVPETTTLLGRLPVRPGGAGKIKAGQPVHIQLDDYPFKEFGLVTGRVQAISMVAREGANLVSIEVPHPLKTSFRKELQFKQEMTGEGRIVTEDISLLGRILYEVRRAFADNLAS